MTIVNSPDVVATAIRLRKEGRDAAALLLEMGMLQLAFDFRKRARAENIDRADQIDGLAKLFSAVIIAHASGIKPLAQRAVVAAGILSLVEQHMLDAATGVMEEV